MIEAVVEKSANGLREIPKASQLLHPDLVATAISKLPMIPQDVSWWQKIFGMT